MLLERAYAAVVHTRNTDNLGNVACHLLTSKTRVAPVKRVSLSRLELCAVHLAAKQVRTLEMLSGTKFSTSQFFAWTDSTTTLQWLSRRPRTWKTFVASRVADIQNILPRENRQHVPRKSYLRTLDLVEQQLSNLSLLIIGGTALHGCRRNPMNAPLLVCYQKKFLRHDKKKIVDKQPS